VTPSLSIVPRPLSPFLPVWQYFYVRRSERPQTAEFGPSRGGSAKEAKLELCPFQALDRH